MTINETEAQNLENYYLCSKETSAVFITGEKGLGKSTIISEFRAKYPNIIYVKSIGKQVFYLDPVIRAINSFLKQEDMKDCYYPSLQSGFSVEEDITRQIFEIATARRISIVFESINTFDSSLLLFCRDLIHSFLTHYATTNTFIITEIDDDDDLHENNNSLILQSIYSISPRIRFIRLARLSFEQLNQYFYGVFDNNISIEEHDRNYIIQSAFGNIMYLNIIVNYLKQIGLIYDEGTQVKCKPLPRGVLSQVLRQYIIFRFNKLDEHMKYVLSRSSVIGRVFDKRILYSQFQILQANEVLQQIERVSQLIFEQNQYQYSFENDEVFYLIQEKIPASEKNEWHTILAEYYKSQIEFNDTFDGTPSESYLNNIYLAAHHYEQCQEFTRALPLYLRLISIYIALMDYHKAIETIEKVQRELEYIKYAPKYETIRGELLIQSADCHRMLGNYEKAIVMYKSIEIRYCHVLQFHELMRAQLGLAYCLHMKGELPNALTVALKMKNALKDDQQTSLYYQVLAFLSSVYDLLGEYAKSQQYYTWSINHCLKHGLEHEYYTQLKKASMVFDLQISQPMQIEAARFFEKQQNIRELAETYHNLGTDSLYLDEYTLAQQYLEKSIGLYKRYNSSAVHYSLNTKAIFLSIFDHKPNEALQVLEEALSYLSQKTELLSQVTLQINFAAVLMQLGLYEESRQRIDKADSLIGSPEGELIPFCQIYSCFAWALYYIHIGQRENAISRLSSCLKLPDLPKKHQYLAANLLLELDSEDRVFPNLKQMANIDCEPLMKRFLNEHLFFATLRCWE